MRIVHHARYVHYFELSRIAFLDEHDRPYRDYVAEGLHYAVTRCEVGYQMPARFDDRLEVTCWIDWLKRVSLAIGYVIRRGDDLIATGATEHAMVSDEGKLVPIPAGRREVLQAALAARAGDGAREIGARRDEPPVLREIAGAAPGEHAHEPAGAPVERGELALGERAGDHPHLVVAAHPARE